MAGRGRGVRPGGGGGREAVLPGRRRTWSVSGARAPGHAPPERRRPFCPPAEESSTRPTGSGDSPEAASPRAPASGARGTLF